MNENQKLKEIIRLGSELHTVQDVDILLERILLEARKFASADAGTIYSRDGDQLVFSNTQNETQQKKLAPGKKLIYSLFTIPINKGSIAGYVAVTGKPLNIPDVYSISSEAPYRFDPTYDVKSGYRTSSMLTVPLKNVNGEILGVIQIINAKNQKGKIKTFSAVDEMYISHFAGSASMVLQRAILTRTLLLRMILMAELRDPRETGAHVNRVASYSVVLYEKWAQKAGLPEKEVMLSRDVLRMASMLHDAGKVAISDTILKKKARFTDEEYEIMKAHTYLGARLFRDRQSILDDVAAEVALTHHENWDGTGYPGKIDPMTGETLEAGEDEKPLPLKGEEIPLFGRIVALADVFDALSSKRVYKEAWNEDDVLQEIRLLKGKKFDPALVEIFFESLEEIRAIQSRYPDEE